MVDTKITDLTEDTTPSGTDLLITVDDPAGSPVNKKATIANVTRLKIDKAISATDKILGRATAGAGDVEEIPCTPAGRAILDDANAAAQIATLGAVATGDARLSDARPASDVSAWAKAGTKPAYNYSEVGAAATGDARLSDARIPIAHTHPKSQITDMPTTLPASDVYAWAKAATAPAMRAITTGSSTQTALEPTVVTHGLGTTPSYVGITPVNIVGPNHDWYISERTPTTFTVSAGMTQSTVASFIWIAVA